MTLKTFVAVTSSIFILQIFTIHVSLSIPIDFPNDDNRYSQQSFHQSRMRSQQQQQQHQNHHQYRQQNQGKSLEMEEFDRSHSPHSNNFRRNAAFNFDIKKNAGNFQHNHPEAFGRTSDDSIFYHSHEDFQQPHSKRIFRHQPPPLIVPAEVRHASKSSSGHNFQHSSQNPPQRFQNHRESQANSIPESNIYHHHNVFNENGKSFGFKAAKDDLRYSNLYRMDNPRRVEEKNSPNNLPLSSHGHYAPTLVKILVPNGSGNSTMFIEYDISDRDVTSETTVEVEETENIESNEI